MLIYIVIATFFFVGFFVPKRGQKLYYYISLIILFLFTAFRDINLGGYDAENYQRFFYYQTPLLSDMINYNHEYAYGYALFNSIIKTIKNNYEIYQVLYTALSIYLLHIVIKKMNFQNKDRLLFLFIYFTYRYLWNGFVLLRQNIAVLIFWIALLTLLNKPFKYTISVWLAGTWHKTAVINIISYPIIKVINKYSKAKMLLTTFITSMFFLIFTKPLFNAFVKIVIIIGGDKYSRYFFDMDNNMGFNPINYILRWIFVLIFYFSYDKIEYKNKKMLLNIGFITIILGSINTAIVSRMLEYYMISIYMIITLSYQAFRQREKNIYLLGIYTVFILILGRFLMTFSGGELMNYSLFFQ